MILLAIMALPRRPRPSRYLYCLPALCLMLCDTTSFIIPSRSLYRSPPTTGIDFAHLCGSSSSRPLYAPPSGVSTRHRGRISAANIDGIDGDDDGGIFQEEELAFAPRTERESYVTESQQAEQANLLASTMMASGGPGSSEIELQTEVSNSFLQYALSIILGRAIPDARDGLKPVHRRILYAMHQLNLAPTSSHRKSARVVGEVLGKFHPHGDMAVYDALVRLAQDFSTNYPLIDGHGNFGSIDADPAAAMRYTECRLTSITQAALMQDLNEAVVDFVSNFDGNEIEPVVLPARLPILLLNGASGIAVGMATNIPPHNLREVMSACTAMVGARQSGTAISDKKLFSLVPAPDFPTGASILGTAGAHRLYSTSNGGVVMRAITQIENVVVGRKGQTRTAIVVTELPYQVNKAALLEKIAGLVNDKRLEGIADLRDESDRDGIRVVIELKRDAVANVVLNNLYRKTPLQTTFSGNFLALMQSKSSGTQTQSLVPQRFTLRQALDCFLDFRFETVRRKSRYELSKVDARAHIVDGLLAALENVDKVIDIVRKSSDQSSAKTKLQKVLGTSEAQTDAILRLQLGQLTRLNKGKLTEENADLEKSRQRLTALLNDDDVVYDALKAEFVELSEKYGEDRKSRIEGGEDGELSDIDLIKNSRSVIVVLRSGYIKRMPLQDFESQHRGTRGKRGTTDGGDSDDNDVAHCFTCNDHDTLLMVTQRGVAFGIRAFQIPSAGRTARGQPIPSVLPVSSDDVITAVLPVSEFSKDEYLVLATEKGWIKKTSLSAFEKISSRGLTIATVEPDDRLNWCQRCRDGDTILVGSKLGMATRFESDVLRPTSRTSRGIFTMNLREGDRLADINVLQGGDTEGRESVLTVTERGFGKRIATRDFPIRARRARGVIAIKFKKGIDDRVSCLLAVQPDDEILLITSKGIMVRQKVSNIPAQSRTATGVTIQRLDDGDHITQVSIVPKYEETDSEA